MWKKKYFIEKKKTPPMEERVLLLKTDLEQIHKKTIQTMDAETKHASQMGYAKELETGVGIYYLVCFTFDTHIFRISKEFSHANNTYAS